MSTSGMTYAGSGVSYDAMDPFKLAAQRLAAGTALRRFGIEPIESSRGESVYAMRFGDRYIGHVEEGLGTKNLVADHLLQQGLSQRSFYDHLAQDTVAMIVNDMITLGIFPVAVAMHLAVAESSWFENEGRATDLLEGWADACRLARCTWSGGETPTLKDVIVPGCSLLSGSAWGQSWDDYLLDPSLIRHNDAIVLLTSSGIHANGLTLARKIATLPSVPEGYMTKLDDGRPYGESLLDPTHIYVGFVEDCLKAGIDLHYGVNITGHGWRKLMRAPQPFSYVIEHVTGVQPVFRFIQEKGSVSDQEMYGNFNMGAGFALYVHERDVDVMHSMVQNGGYLFDMILAGRVRESDQKKVIIDPMNLEFSSETLAVR